MKKIRSSSSGDDDSNEDNMGTSAEIESEDALRIAKMREQHIIELIHSRNKLASYAPFLIKYVLLLFFTVSIVAYYPYCKSFSLTKNPTCSSYLPIIDYDPSNQYRKYHYFVTGAYGGTFALILIQIIDSEKKGLIWNSRLYCNATISFIGFLTSVIISAEIIPPFYNAFDQIVLLPRLLQWLCTAPMLIFMILSLDVRNFDESIFMWSSVIAQQLAVISGLISNTTSNYTVAVIFLVFATGSIFSTIVTCYFTFRKINLVVEETIEVESRKKDQAVIYTNPSTVSRILRSEENVGISISFLLVIYSTFFWILTALVYFSGLNKLIDAGQEAVLQSIVDLVMKCFYGQVLCSSHGTILSPEGLLMRLIILEEKASAMFRQSIRYVFHELSSPLNTISLGIESIDDSNLTEQGKEALDLSKSSCTSIVGNLKEIRELNSGEDVVIKPTAFNFKELVREAARSHGKVASGRSVMLLLAIDRLIPEQLLGDVNKIKSIISCLVLNGISLARQPDGTCTVLATPATKLPSTPNSYGVRFAVKDDGDGFRDDSKDGIVSWSTAAPKVMSMSPYLFKKIIEAHGGIIGVDSSPGKGSCFYFEVTFPLPVLTEPVVEVISKSRALRAGGSNVPAPPVFRAVVSNASTPLTSTRSRPQITPPTNDSSALLLPERREALPSPTAQKQESPKSVHRPPPPPPSVRPLSSTTASPTASMKSPIPSPPPPLRQQQPQLPSPPVPVRTTVPGTYVSKASRPDPPTLFGTHVLVVDDVSSNRRMTGRILERMGFVVEEAEDGIEAVNMCSSKMTTPGEYSLIMMDNMMPRMTGRDATKKLRELEFSGLIVGLTGNVLDEDLEEFAKSGCNEVITKPLDVSELKRTLISLGLSIPNKSFK